MALDSAKKSDHVDSFFDENSNRIFSITPLGYRVIEEMYLNTSPILRRMIDDNFEAFLGDDQKNEPEPLNDLVPASDRFVRIGDNMPGYTEVITNVEQASEAIRGSNELPAESRSWVKVHLDLGVELLRKGGTTLRSALNSLIIEPLKAALAETSEEGIKRILKAALTALKAFLGI